jgi:hypothetical protein
MSVHETEETGAASGPSASAVHGVPAGTVTLTDWPVISVAVITRCCAEAGPRDEPSPTVRPPATIRLMNSLLLFIARPAALTADPTKAISLPSQHATDGF